MKATDYIQAVLELIQEGMSTDKVFKNLREVLKSKGHDRLYAGILKGLAINLEKSKTTSDVVLTVESEKNAKKFKKQVVETLNELGITARINKPSIIEDESVIGGYKVTYNNKTIDNTYKSHLINLYHHVTK